jgi:hypothetical protein
VATPNNDKPFFAILKGAIAVAVTLVTICIVCSSCKLFYNLGKGKEQSRSDSVGVKKQTEQTSKVDTSKSKTESTYSKETTYYPQPIYVNGPEPKIVFVPQTVTESGTSKQESFNAVFENWKKNYEDSVAKAEAMKTKNKEVEVTAKTDWLTIGMLAAIALLFLQKFVSIKLPFKIKTNE